MRIKEAINTRHGPLIPPSIERNIKLQTTCELEEREFIALQTSLFLLADYQKVEPFPASAVCTVLCTHLQEITLVNDETILLGAAPFLAILFLRPIRQCRNLSWLDLIPVFLEEICHSLYNEPNEYRVKQLVCHIVNQKFGMSLHKTYPSVFDENDDLIQSAYPEDYFELSY